MHQIALKFGFIKKKENLNASVYADITKAFVSKYGDKAGWAHQILFAGDLSSFKEKIDNAKIETQEKTEQKVVKNKKRQLKDVTEAPKVVLEKKRKL